MEIFIFNVFCKKTPANRIDSDQMPHSAKSERPYLHMSPNGFPVLLGLKIQFSAYRYAINNSTVQPLNMNLVSMHTICFEINHTGYPETTNTPDKTNAVEINKWDSV